MRKRLFNQQSEPRSREAQKAWWLSVKAKIMMALFALMLMSQGSLAQVYIKHNDTWYDTSGFAAVAFGDGTVSYSTTTGVLTLNNATINGCIYSFGSLNIQLIGINTIDATDSCAIKRIVNPDAQTHINIYSATFNGTGQLLAKTTVYTKCTVGFTSMNYNDGLNCLLGSTDQSAAFIATQVLGGGDGSSSSNAYLIKTPEHLQMLSDIFGSGLFDNGSGKYFKLVNNINCASLSNFKPIFATNSFQGTFDGNNCIISNLTVGSNFSGNSGLFDVVDGGSIKNLTLENCNCSGSGNVGAVVAKMSSGSVTNVLLNDGTISAWGRSSLAGALIGEYNDGTLTGNKYTYNVSVNNRTGYSQRGVGNKNEDVLGQYELDTRKVIVECGENGSFSPKEGSFYMLAGKTCYVAAGYDFTLVVTPNSNYQPTLTLSDASIAMTAVDKNANGSVSTEFTFKMPNVNVTATVAFTLNIASTDYTASIADADYTATGSLVPTTVTLTDNTGNTITLTSNDFTVTGYTLNGEPVKAPDKAGTYLVSIQGTGSYSGVKTNITYTVNKINATVTAPTAKTLTYTGSAQELVNAGSATGGTLEYSLDGTTYGTAIPKGTDAKTYTVYYRVTADANHNDVAAASISVTIGKANAAVTAPTAKTLTYTGSAQELVNAGSATGGTLEYSLDGTTYGTAIPKGTDAKTYTVYYRVTADANHNDVAAASIGVTIGKANATVTAPTAKILTYTGSAQELVNAGSATGGTLEYSLDGTTYGTAIPKGTDAKTYTVYYRVTADANHNDVAAASISVTIAKVGATVTAPTAKTLTYTGSAQELVNAGSATGGTIEYSLDGTNYGTAIPKGKDAKTYTVYYRVTGDANHNGVAAASIRVTISKAVGSISYATTVINKTSIEAAFTNKLSLTGDGTVTYASSNPAVATVDAAGKVSIKGVGQTVITATVADGTNYTYNPNKATYTLKVASATMTVTTSGYTGAYDGAAHGITVTAPAGATVMYGETEGTYNLNASPTYTNVGTYIVYYQVTKTNFTTVKGSATVTINKADVKVLYEDDQFTVKKGDTFEPPHLTLDPADLPISYRSSDPEVATVDDQTGEVTTLSLGETLIYAEFVGDDNRNPASACYLLTVVQRDIEPIDEDVVIVWKDEDFFYTNDEGEKEEVKLTNIVLYDILFTLNVTGDPSESDGYDETEHGIVLNTPMSLRNAYYAITQGHEPGSDEYAEEFTGLTFKVPAGTGYVIIDSRTDGKHQMMVNIGSLPPVAINHKDRDKDSIFYECSVPTWVYVYNGGEVSGARMNAIPKAKKTKGHVIIYSVTRTSQKNVAGIEQINSDAFDETERWYDLQGNRINRPTKKGIYILGGQKVIVQ